MAYLSLGFNDKMPEIGFEVSIVWGFGYSTMWRYPTMWGSQASNYVGTHGRASPQDPCNT